MAKSIKNNISNYLKMRKLYGKQTNSILKALITCWLSRLCKFIRLKIKVQTNLCLVIRCDPEYIY